MERKHKIIFENEDKKVDIMPKNNNSSFKNSIIEGNGSESSLKTINSQSKEIDNSSISSLNAVGKSSNSLNISNENNNKINNKNEHSSSFNNSNKVQINNINNKEDLIDSKISLINSRDLSGSKGEISALIDMIGNGKEDNNLNKFLDTNISNNNLSENNSNNFKNINNEKLNQINNKKKELLSSNITNNNMEFKNEVKEMINKGYIPFFIKAKDFNPVFYYGKPHSKLRTVIEQYIKKVNGSNEIQNLFYYKNKLIDLDSTLGELKLKPLSLISDENK